MEKLWQRLEDGMFPNAGENPEWFEQFKHLAVTRERAGRDEFGFAYLSPNRDNIAEAAEELGDFIVYVFLDSLRARRENGGDDEDIDVVLTAASLAAQAFEHLSRLKHKRRGAP
jgi:ATP-dependent RNA circularization protein (DNA/RNA ligase family)